jgi:DNA-binding MarR family transcriptional regulator
VPSPDGVPGLDTSPTPDSIDAIRASWRALLPDLDTSAADTIGRVLRIARHITILSDRLLAEFGITRGEFDVLSAVRRSPDALTPSALARVLITSNASITKRMVHLESLGLAVRERAAADRRVVRVRLTAEGTALIDAAVPAQLGFERDVVAVLDSPQRAGMELALRDVLGELERRAADS